jgi:hypothetical protein
MSMMLTIFTVVLHRNSQVYVMVGHLPLWRRYVNTESESAGLGVFRSSEISLSPRCFIIALQPISRISKDYLYNFNLSAGIVNNIISGSGETGLLTQYQVFIQQDQ